MEKFLISNRRDGQFQFSLKDENGYEILRSEGYSTKVACLATVELLKNHCTNNSLYNNYQNSPAGKFYFDLRTGNGYKIASSEMFDSRESRDKVIALIKVIAPNAIIDDQTIIRELS